MKRVEPATRLVYSLCYEIRRVSLVLVDKLLILKRIVQLSVRHRTRVKPNIYQVAFSLHRFSTVRN